MKQSLGEQVLIYGSAVQMPSHRWGRGDSGGGEKFPAGTNTFQVEGTVPHLSRPTVWQALAQAMNIHYIASS